MKTAWKLLICLLCTASILASFCACGGAAAPAETAAPETASAAVEADAAEEEEDMTPAYLFSKGVWAASIDGKIDTYFVFYDEANGRTERADGTGGTPFTCEQSGWNAVFHFGSADDVTKATFSEGEITGTFYYSNETVVYSFEYLPDADPDTFEVPAE